MPECTPMGITGRRWLAWCMFAVIVTAAPETEEAVLP